MYRVIIGVSQDKTVRMLLFVDASAGPPAEYHGCPIIDEKTL
jgi:hypothetical protein